MPHEVDMTKALIMSLDDWRGSHLQCGRITEVRLLVGQFTCVEPDLLKSAFAKQRKGTFLEDARLVVRESPFIAYCDECEADYRPDIVMEYACPRCRAPLSEIRSGRELKIESVQTALLEDREWKQSA